MKTIAELSRAAAGWVATTVAMLCAPAAFGQLFEHPSSTPIDPAYARKVELAHEAAMQVPISSFYDAPVPLGPGKAGALLRTESVTNLPLPDGATAVRILYLGRSPADTPVTVSGIVLVPTGKPPAGGWPVIAWAHGTTGVERICAPSLSKDLGTYEWIEINSLLDMGYAVVATDYQGLGTQGQHPYLDKITNAWDTIYSVPAARSAVKSLSPRWVAMGHSQGGLAVAGVAELEATSKDPNYLGAVAIAGAWDAEKVVVRMNEPGADPLNAGYLAMFARGLQAIDANYKPEQILSAQGMKRVQEEGQHCWEVEIAFTFDLPQGTIYKPEWRTNPTVRKIFERDRLHGPIAGPLLVIASTDDESIPAKTTVDENVERLCAAHSDVQYVRFAGIGIDHDGTERATMGLRYRWIQDRFSGLPTHPNCSVHSPRS
jgi:alpha-beta hydrolase superfamily lysophospholipase